MLKKYAFIILFLTTRLLLTSHGLTTGSNDRAANIGPAVKPRRFGVLKRGKQLLFLVLLTLTTISFAEKKELALTIDDLPFVGENKNFHLNMILSAIQANEIPATGFIIAKEVTAQNWDMLRKFHDAGLGLGNHTLSHANLNRIGPDAYIQDIAAADKILSPVLTEPKYFRYPYLATGTGQNKGKVQQYLFSKNYQIAPISIDSKDFIFNQLLLSVPENARRAFLTVLKPCYLDFIWQQTLKAEEHNRAAHTPEQAQILLIHANLLNAYVLPDIINLYKQNGFTFVSLENALKPSERGHTELASRQQHLKKAAFEESSMAWD